MSPRPRLSEQHPDLQTAIRTTAWGQIAAFGAANLSLRAIARELKIAVTSIYNYYPSRDDLVTALIVEAFNSLADSQESVLKENKASDLNIQLTSLGLGYRDWAVQNPQCYHLIFGTPIPHYDAPEDVTIPAATRALVPLSKVVQKISLAGKLRTERLAPLTPQLKSMLKAWQQIEGGTDLEVLYLVLVIWSRVHGLVLLEIGNQFPAFISDPGEIFRREINNILIQYQ